MAGPNKEDWWALGTVAVALGTMVIAGKKIYDNRPMQCPGVGGKPCVHKTSWWTEPNMITAANTRGHCDECHEALPPSPPFLSDFGSIDRA